ncbi:MAG: hypothetical protein HQK54_15920, partial [Oligoflexales bacterium]|nr:hypothetical protein [Oligoflexales bacterium]
MRKLFCIISLTSLFTFACVFFSMSCTKKKENSGTSRITFYDDNFFKFGGSSQDSLSLRSTPICNLSLASRLGTLDDTTDKGFVLKFFKVNYEKLPEDQAVNGSVDGKAVSVVATEKQSFLSKDIVESQKIEIVPQFYDDSAMNDGHYLAILCKTESACLPPSIESLNQYKEKFQRGECGKASDGQLSAACKEILLSGAVDGSFFGITYPVTVKNSKFVQGDNDFVYLAATSDETEGSVCGGKSAKNSVIFETGVNPQSDPNNVTTADTSNRDTPDSNASNPGQTTASSDSGFVPDMSNFGNINTTSPGSFGANNGITPVAPPPMPPPLPPMPPPMPPPLPPMPPMNIMPSFHSCFSAGTKIAVVQIDGNNKITKFGLKKVEDIAIGDLV